MTRLEPEDIDALVAAGLIEVVDAPETERLCMDLMTQELCDLAALPSPVPTEQARAIVGNLRRLSRQLPRFEEPQDRRLSTWMLACATQLGPLREAQVLDALQGRKRKHLGTLKPELRASLSAVGIHNATQLAQLSPQELSQTTGLSLATAERLTHAARGWLATH